MLIDLQALYFYILHILHILLHRELLLLPSVVAWLSGNALVSINEVTLRRARLVLGWVTVCERVKPSPYVANQLGRLSLLPSVGW